MNLLNEMMNIKCLIYEPNLQNVPGTGACLVGDRWCCCCCCCCCVRRIAFRYVDSDDPVELLEDSHNWYSYRDAERIECPKPMAMQNYFHIANIKTVQFFGVESTKVFIINTIYTVCIRDFYLNLVKVMRWATFDQFWSN